MNCFKRVGEKVMAKTFEHQVTELNMRASILNQFSDLGQEQFDLWTLYATTPNQPEVVPSTNFDSAAVAVTHGFIARVRSQPHIGHLRTDVKAGRVTSFRVAAHASQQGAPGGCQMSAIAVHE